MEAIIKDTLNKEQTKELFEKEAVFMFGQDAVPQYRIVELFGEDYAEWLVQHTGPIDGYLKGGLDWNAAGDCSDIMITYYLFHGFQYIVGEHNTRLLTKRHKQSEAGQLITAIKEERYCKLRERDEEDERKRQERKAKRAAAKAKREAEQKGELQA